MKLRQIQIEMSAKLNLTLTVFAPLQDATHPIESKMVKIALKDTLEVTRLNNQSSSRYVVEWHENAPRKSMIDWNITSDLAVRAHQLLEEQVGHALPVDMKLSKRIPVGGGLGGGSADAVGMLQATIALFNLDVNPVDFAGSLGSDTLFFIHEGHAIVSGIGNEIKPIPFVPIDVVLIMPEYGCSTIEVYKAFDALEEQQSSGNNDLLVPACHVESRLLHDITTLKEVVNMDIQLSGSGSTMFVICDNKEHATSVAHEIESKTKHVALATHTCTNAMEKL